MSGSIRGPEALEELQSSGEILAGFGAVLRQQLASLERHVSGTREAVSHPNVASAHDDLATAVCGALVVPGNRLAFDQILPVGRWRTDRRRRNR